MLCALGAWTIGVPFLGRAIGLVVNVRVDVEVVDHVLPGTVVALFAGYLAIRARGGGTPEPRRTVCSCFCFLAGFWVLATHVPLIHQAIQGKAGWGPTLWHVSTAPPIVVLSLWSVLKSS